MEPYTPEKLPLGSIDWEKHVSAIGKANRALAKYDGILQVIINPQILLAPLTTQEAVLSSRIEGTQASLEDFLQYEADVGEPSELEEREITPAIGEFHEIKNYCRAMDAAVEELKRRPLCTNVVRDLHRILLAGVRGKNKNPGEIRTSQNWIAPLGTPIERATFVPPDPWEVMDALSNWELYLHSKEEVYIDRIVQLAVLKAQFELIHPFLDGNGRIGRMLVPLILYSKGVISSPTFYISSYLERNRDRYYERLLAISQEGDWNGWIDFFLRAVVEQADENSQKAKAVNELFNRMKQQVPEITHSQYSIQAIDTIFSRPIINSSEFIKKSGIPKPTALKMLRELKDNDILKLSREGRGRRPNTYAFSELIDIIQLSVF